MSCYDIHGRLRMNPKGFICDSICSLTAVCTNVPSVANKVLFLSQDQGQMQNNPISRIMFFLMTVSLKHTYSPMTSLNLFPLCHSERSRTHCWCPQHIMTTAERSDGVTNNDTVTAACPCTFVIFCPVMLQLYIPRHVEFKKWTPDGKLSKLSRDFRK